jgi:drug/metabolite transporter (DMT)-like permease
MTEEKTLDSRAVLGTAYALFAAIGFSGKAILVKLAYFKGVDAITLLALRMLFSMPFFMLAILWSRRQNHARQIEKRDWFAIIGLGLVGYYLASLLDFLGLQTISAGMERLILFLYPTMVIMLTALIYKRAITRREVIALVLSYAGISLVFMHDVHVATEGLVFGALLVFGSTLAYSIYLIGAGNTIARLGVIRFTSYALLVSSMANLLQFVLSRPMDALHQPIQVYGYALAMAIFSTVLPVFMLSAGIRLIGSGKTALIGSVGPVSTLLMAQWFLHERMSPLQIFGSALILAGVLSLNLKRLAASPRNPTKWTDLSLGPATIQEEEP